MVNEPTRQGGIISDVLALDDPRHLDFMRHAVVVVTVFILGLIWWQTYARLNSEYEFAFESARKDTQNMAYLVAGQFSHTIDRLAGIHGSVEEFLGSNGSWDRKLDRALLSEPALMSLAVLDLNGTLRHSSAQRFSDQAQLEWARSKITGGLAGKRAVIRKPESDDWRMAVLVPIREGGRETGSLRGGLLLTLDIGYFFLDFQKLDLGDRGEVTAFSDDGFEVLRARKAGLMEPRNGSPPALMVSSGLREMAPFSAVDSEFEQRLYSLAPVAAAAMHVAVSRSHQEIAEGRAAVRKRYLAWAMLITVCAGIGSYALALLMKRQSRTWRALMRTKDENRDLIRQLEGEKSKAYQLAYYDQLTGLPNRNFFRAMALDRLIGSRRRRKASALLFIDLDRFKAVNDNHGHQVGDQLLIEVARRLKESLRESDLVSRFGGDEFVIQVVDLDALNALDTLAEKLIEAIGRPYRFGSIDLDILPSIGISVCPQDGESIETLLKNADAAMYEAKRSGRGEYRFFDAQLNARVQRYSNLEQRIKLAIASQEFVMHYQPRVSTLGYRVVSLEALVRWNHPEYGMVFPGDFIPLAEASGQIVDLGAAILHQVCRQIATWRAAGLHTPSVAVNASVKQLQDDGFIALVSEAVTAAGISYADIEIEVTESCLMDDPEMSASILQSLVDLGVRVSLDDYGTGYSSLSSIKRLPLYAIKIDRSFVSDIGIDSNDDVIVASTISMGHGLGLRIVAEGVETRDQLMRLRILGCEEVQGYLFSRPLPVDEIEKILQRGVCWPHGVKIDEVESV